MKAENIIYQKGKWIRYGIMAIGLLIVIISIKNTLNLYFKYDQLQNDLESVEALPAASEVTYPLEIFEKIDLNKTIFEAISEAASINNVIVKKISTPLIHKEDEHLVMTEEVTVEGDFIKILRCMDLADAKLGLIKISSLKFERIESAKSSVLLLKVYFQIVKPEDHAK